MGVFFFDVLRNTQTKTLRLISTQVSVNPAFSYLVDLDMQWAAVTTQSGWTKDPPQLNRPDFNIAIWMENKRH
jgi:hypothetical protein